MTSRLTETEANLSKLDGLLAVAGAGRDLLDFARGVERALAHVFSVGYPMYLESREVFSQMDSYFKAH